MKYDITEYLRVIPDVKDRGIEHTSKCPCGGTLTAIRHKKSGHLCVKCDKCKFKLIE